MTKYASLFEITDTVALDGLGYVGGVGVVVINQTGAWLQAFNTNLNALDAPVKGEEKERLLQEQYDLLPTVIKSITLNGETYAIESADDARRVDETIDNRLLDFLTWEAMDRRKASVDALRYGNRLERATSLMSGKGKERHAPAPEGEG